MPTSFPYRIRQTVAGDFALEAQPGTDAVDGVVDVFLTEHDVHRVFETRRAKRILAGHWAQAMELALKTVAQHRTMRHALAP
jgi:hypothetical protein